MEHPKIEDHLESTDKDIYEVAKKVKLILKIKKKSKIAKFIWLIWLSLVYFFKSSITS